MGELLANVIAIGHELTYLGRAVPLVGRALGRSHNGNGSQVAFQQLRHNAPHLRQLPAEINPGALAGLPVANLPEQVQPVIAGDANLVAAQRQLQEDASFHVIGDMPVCLFLSFLGAPTGSEAGLEGTSKGEDVLSLAN